MKGICYSNKKGRGGKKYLGRKKGQSLSTRFQYFDLLGSGLFGFIDILNPFWQKKKFTPISKIKSNYKLKKNSLNKQQQYATSSKQIEEEISYSHSNAKQNLNKLPLDAPSMLPTIELRFTLLRILYYDTSNIMITSMAHSQLSLTHINCCPVIVPLNFH